MSEWYPKKRIGDLPSQMSLRFGSLEALRFGDRRFSFADIDDEVDVAARALMALGVRSGDHVALWLNNRPDWIFLQYAVAKIGAVLVPVNPRFRREDLAYILRQSDSTVLITHKTSGPINYLDMAREVIRMPDNGSDISDPDLPMLRKLVILDDEEHHGTVGWQEAKADAQSIGSESLAQRAGSVDPDAMWLILYTSGSTGFPKGVMHSHILIRSLEQRAYKFNLNDRDTIINYLPLSHAFGLSEGSLMSMITGARQILTETFDPEQALDIIEAERVTITHGFDTHMSMLMDAQERKPRDISSLRFGWLPAGPSNVVPTAYRARKVLAPLKTFSGFGMTETWTGACIGSLDDTDEQLCEASGVPSLGFELRIIDPATNAPAEVGVQGEIQIRGFTVTKGYYNMPGETAATFTEDGWLKSGDMGYIRPDGLLRFFGRFKDMLKVGGENVDPLEIEGHLLKRPEVQQISVVGLPDKKLSEVPVAYVQVKGGATIGEADIIGACRQSMASFKIPRHVVFVEDFPMTASGKIRKMDLRADAIQRFGAAS